MARDLKARAWEVTFAGTAVNLCLGILYAWSVFVVFTAPLVRLERPYQAMVCEELTLARDYGHLVPIVDGGMTFSPERSERSVTAPTSCR